jgi:hypothetical protein
MRLIVLSIVAVTALVVAAEASSRGDWWFKTPGGAACPKLLHVLR